MRKNARLLLKKRWLSASLVTLVVAVAVLAFFVLQFTLADSLVFLSAVSILAIRPLLMGHKRWCAKLNFERKPSFRELFFFFSTPKMYLKSIFTGLAVSLRVLLVALLSALPVAFCFTLAKWLELQPYSEITEIFIKNCTMLGFVAIPVFSLVFILATVKNIAIPYFIAEDENTGIIDAVRMSSRFIKDRGLYLLKTVLIFLPLCLLIVPLFVLIPYFTTLFGLCIKEFKTE